MGRQWLCNLIFVLIAMPAIGAPKTDVVVFNNGDRLTGEVRSLERGQLRFKTDATDTISTEWDDIAYLSSSQNIQVETEEGMRYLGHITRAASEYLAVVETESGPLELESASVVLMAPIEEKVVSRLDSDITAAINFAKASEIQQVQFGLEVDYRTETRIIGLQIDATQSDSADNESSQRESLNLNYRRRLSNRQMVISLPPMLES